MTTLPLCRITSRSLGLPPGSRSLSWSTRKSGPSYTTLELMSFSVSPAGALPDLGLSGEECCLFFFDFSFLFLAVFLAMGESISLCRLEKYRGKDRGQGSYQGVRSGIRERRASLLAFGRDKPE